MNIQLINEIAKGLGILRESYEDDASWQYRVKYSTLGLQALASLYDKNDDIIVEEITDSTVSHQHVTSRMQRLLQIYDISESDALKILELYKKTGYVLSKRNRLTYPKTTIARASDVYLARGVHPSKATKVSGACMMITSCVADEINIGEMFGFSSLDINFWYAKFIKTISNWKQFSEAEEVEHLNINEPANKGYWRGEPPQSGEITICRSVDRFHYWMLKATPYGIERASLPDWRTHDGEYYRIAIALRTMYGNPPRMKVKKHQNTVIIEYDYLLPPAEQNFVELCSWRMNKNDNEYMQRLNRVIAIDLCADIATLFAKMGYTIEEE